MSRANREGGVGKLLSTAASALIAMSAFGLPTARAYAEDRCECTQQGPTGSAQSDPPGDIGWPVGMAAESAVAAKGPEYLEGIEYYRSDANGAPPANRITCEKPCMVLTSDMRELDYGYYVVNKATAMEGRLEVLGDVHLIVGAGLFTCGTIHVPEGSTLHLHLMAGKDGSSYICGDDDGPAIANEGKVVIAGDLELSGRASRGIDNRGALVMYCGRIDDCGAVGVSNKGTFDMYGGEIGGCTRAAVVNKGEFTLHDGRISNGRGDGVRAERGSTTRLHGGSVAGSTGMGVRADGEVYVSGDPCVADNAKGDVVLRGCTHQYFRLDGRLEEGAQIGVKCPKNHTFVVGYRGCQGDDDPTRFFTSNDGRTLVTDAIGNPLFVS